ncbi:hypothetical protein [Anabaena sp. AL09]|jgi:hypothetical protein|uniref:hypothetical protein n=1 Tax=Anabaena sp. AL09 TaxID=1710891 RepID=UPI0007FF6079|nr:hypothetical protein [Anabaena sp. AL09]OBQ01660.1 MAG: hypothetical protein AN490_20270 [Anabaena sp. AL09]
MSKKKLKRLLAVSAVSFSCLWLSVVPINKAWAQTSREAEISIYIQQLKDNNGIVSYYAYKGGSILTKQYNPAEPDKPGQPPLNKAAIFYGLSINETTKLPVFTYSTKDKTNLVVGGTTKTEIAL